MECCVLTDCRILIADGDVASVDVLKQILERAGFSNILSTADALQISPLCSSFQPDILLIDLNMLSSVGSEVRRLFPVSIAPENDTPILVMTGDVTTTARESILAFGSDFLIKPFHAGEALRRVNSLLQNRFQGEALDALVRARTRDLEAALMSRFEHRQQMSEETVLLKKTLTGCVAVMTEILSLEDPATHSWSLALRGYVKECAHVLEFADQWQLELAVMLCRIGQIAIPGDVKARLNTGQSLSRHEQKLIESMPEIGRNLLIKIPRLEPVAMMILYQNKQFDGKGFPEDNLKGKNIPRESRLIKILADLVTLEMNGTSRHGCFRIMSGRAGWYDPDLFAAVQEHLSVPDEPGAPATALSTARIAEIQATERAVERAKSAAQLGSKQVDQETACIGIPMFVHDLQPGFVLAQHLRYTDGTLLLSANSIITEVVLERLLSWSKMKPVKQPVYIKPAPKRG